jgi:hypothetical protein
MNHISTKQKEISSVLKIVVILSAIIGTFLSAYAGRHSFMGGSRVFMYFTTQSNIAIAIICCIGFVLMHKGREVSRVWQVVKFVGTVSITLTGVVFCVMLAPLLGSYAWTIQNVLTHVVVPLAAVIDFFVVAVSDSIPRKNVIYVIIPPILYAIYAGIGYVQGWQFADGINYPYFFLNWGSPAGAFGFSKKLPFLGTAWWIMILLIFLLCVGYGYLALAEFIGKKHNKK